MPGRVDSGHSSPKHSRRNLRHRFEVIRTLGQGTYGKVKLAVERKTGEAFAIKTVRKKAIGTEHDLNRLRREIEIMTRLNHPHIIQVYEVFENHDKIILVMEYASGGELYDYCNDRRGLYDDQARKFFRQIVSAVHYLHKNGIVHRDLKLENIVLDSNGDAKIADFGFANVCLTDKLLSTFCGSPLYASPEIVNGLPYNGPEVDCWSLGVLLYAMAYGAMPFDGSDFRRLRNQITAGDYFRPNRPSDAEGLINQLLCPNAASRYTVDDIICHWWVNQGYDCNPVLDVAPGKAFDREALVDKLFGTTHDTTIPSPSSQSDTQSNSQASSPPIKGILKPPKKSTPVKPGVQRSQSLDAKINIAECSVPSQRKMSTPVAAVFDSNKKPKKSILKKRHSDYCGDHDLHVATNNDLNPAQESQSLSPTSDVSSDAHNSSCDSDSSEAAGSAFDLGDIEDVLDDLDPLASKSEPVGEDSGIVDDLSGADTSTTTVSPSEPRSSSHRSRRGKLKSHEPSWRHSSGSQGSTSSTELLNFSYDSGDSDGYVSGELSVPLSLPMVNDDSLDLEVSQMTQEDEETPPPLPDTPPPDIMSKSCPESHFLHIPSNDEIIEKILWLGNQDSSPSPDPESPRTIDWDEVEDIYRQALELQQAWT